MTDKFLESLFKDIVDAYSNASKQADHHLTEFWLSPAKLEMCIDIQITAEGIKPSNERDKNGYVIIEWEKAQTSESVRLELDENNLLLGLTLERDRPYQIQKEIDNARAKETGP